MAYDIGRQKIIILMEGFVEEKVTSCLLVVDVVLDHYESGNNLFECVHIHCI